MNLRIRIAAVTNDTKICISRSVFVVCVCSPAIGACQRVCLKGQDITLLGITFGAFTDLVSLGVGRPGGLT